MAVHVTCYISGQGDSWICSQAPLPPATLWVLHSTLDRGRKAGATEPASPLGRPNLSNCQKGLGLQNFLRPGD